MVIVTQNYETFETCTSNLNVKTLQWTLKSTMTIPLGGFILKGIDTSRIFYLGGFTNDGNEKNDTIYELVDNWQVLELKLPYGMTAWDSILLDSRLNLTRCKN